MSPEPRARLGSGRVLFWPRSRERAARGWLYARAVAPSRAASRSTDMMWRLQDGDKPPQDCLLQIAADRFYTEDASGAGIPPAGGSRVEGSIASRYFGGWSDARRRRDPNRASRRVSSARRAYYARRRHAGPARQRTHTVGSPGRAPLGQWNRLPSLSRSGVMEPQGRSPVKV